MTRTSLTLMLAAAAAIAGCNSEDHNIVAGGVPDDGKTNIAANAGVELPPSIAASKTYRCADNKIIDVDWLSDNKSANIRTEENGPLTHVTAAEPGKPMTAPGGYEINGSATAASVKIAVPGRPSQTCKT